LTKWDINGDKKKPFGLILEVVVYDDDDKPIILEWTFVMECRQIVISKSIIFSVFYHNIIFSGLMEFNI
jgi:hypothetical protein